MHSGDHSCFSNWNNYLMATEKLKIRSLLLYPEFSMFWNYFTLFDQPTSEELLFIMVISLPNPKPE